MTLIIRLEQAEDIQKIAELTQAAFEHVEYSSHTEHFIVNTLRKRNKLTVSLVATDDCQIVGHVAISPVRLSSGDQGWYGLGPISVVPSRQGFGIGSALINAALKQLKNRNAQGCVLLGDTAYYAHFGFKAIKDLRLADVPAEYFQAISFIGYFPQGEVFYDEAFNATQ